MEYRKNKRPTSGFINGFVAKYDVQLPNDIFFNFDMNGFLDENSQRTR